MEMKEKHNGKENKKRKSGFIRTYLGVKGVKIVTIIVIIAIIVCGVAIGINTVFNSRNKTSNIGFEDMGKLVTQSCTCTQIQDTDKAVEWYGFKVPFTQTKYLYSYDVEITAGIDFEQIKWKVDDKKKVITVKLPEAEIISRELDEDSLEVYYEKESAFVKVSLAENNEAIKSMKDEAEQKAIDKGILDNATKNAQKIVKAFFGKNYDLKKYTVKFI